MARVKMICSDDLTWVAEIEAACFSEPWSQSSLELLVREPNVGFAVLEGKRVAAYGGMICVLDEGQITNIATHPDFRRRGYASAVLKSICDYAREVSLSEITLEVRRSNEAAKALYKKHGFVCVGERKGFYTRPAEDAIIMKKTFCGENKCTSWE